MESSTRINSGDGKPSSLSSSKIFVDIGIPDTISSDLVKSVHWVTSFQNHVSSFCDKNSVYLRNIIVVVLYLSYFAYLALAVWYDLDLAAPLLYITSFVLFIKFYALIRDNYGDVIQAHCCIPIGHFIDKQWDYLKWYVINFSLRHYS